jgi:UDP:flavonoid glycosyltransferase YjiC (YdhE family)
MRVLLSTYDSRGGVEPLVRLAVRLRELGAEVRVCAPPDCAERRGEVGVPLVPVGEPVRALVHRATPPSPDDVPRLTAELISTWFDKVATAAEGCDALVASCVIPAAVGARSADLALIDDRDDRFAVGEVIQQALFGRVAAVVHHGGAGTTTTATRAGAPQAGKGRQCPREPRRR